MGLDYHNIFNLLLPGYVLFFQMLSVFEYNKTRLTIRLRGRARVQHKQISIRIKPDRYVSESWSGIPVKVQFFSHHFYNS